MLQPFFVWQNRALIKVNPENVICLVTEGNYTKIFLEDRTYLMVRSTLSNALKKLPPDMFIKVHRSVAVSVYYINSISKDHLLVGNESLPVSKQYYRLVIEKLNIIE